MKKIIVSPSDISLWHIAARYLNDATQANRIMTLNDLSDPIISRTMEIGIPEQDSTRSGGISL
ncbi:MAG: LysM peptidoglycan-binding domain-containing protein [Acetobacter sp.]|jgi:hypothetical protein|nr:LysM peptidoglycan-binding domain-containing protein [Acetobacter sp.]